MNFDQGEFDFEAKGSDEGFRKWRDELDAKKRAFELRWGVILSRHVCVTLKDHLQPLTGKLEIVPPAKKVRQPVPLFRIRSVEFTAMEIDSIVQEEGD